MPASVVNTVAGSVGVPGGTLSGLSSTTPPCVHVSRLRLCPRQPVAPGDENIACIAPSAGSSWVVDVSWTTYCPTGGRSSGHRLPGLGMVEKRPERDQDWDRSARDETETQRLDRN